ncbi:GLPGLI family protein [Subsaximicrobium wynnwilliamsii]|uniref:GLPGLI family protein n=1 Tax=Subsaximicrobium wynnwilliamsii TaxID=291179 RepID=A0A5C6ZM82_9FLAO|nr:GLPGLI family protein [Subsaximicrobium wynnwilliamsii]TXD85465.1 GLPGLI family protein [Subsaximicrobium wynnwilliamsii]TXD90818.1 GLPGLI family protein [Subsaximicrobium wynnwilliamsii]TXE05325.1 GLPGLI family protein [Subsaximicrobium wynnwilliamsii]
MNTLRKLSLLVFFVLTGHLNAQEFTGEATYKTHRKVNIKIDSSKSKISTDQQKQFNEQLKKQFQKTFMLSFSKEESLYKQEEALAKPNPMGNAAQIVFSSNTDVLYKNIKTQTYVEQTDILSKSFLIKDSIKDIAWQLENETKNIGNYTCFKATYTYQHPIRDFENDKDSLRFEARKITAWYTPQIPVSNGPELYQGLPGLILEINDGQQTIICSKIQINPKKTNKIEAPDTGKEVTQTEFDTIKDQKNKEFLERYGVKSKDGSNRIEINLGD